MKRVLTGMNYSLSLTGRLESVCLRTKIGCEKTHQNLETKRGGINQPNYDAMTTRLRRHDEYNFNPRSYETMIGSRDNKPTAFKLGCQHLRGFPTSQYHRQANRTCGAIITTRGNKDSGVPPTTQQAVMGQPTHQWRSLYQ